MKKSILMIAAIAFLFSINTNAQEPKQKKKEKAAKECAVNGKKCCAGEESKGCASEGEGTAKTKKAKRKS